MKEFSQKVLEELNHQYYVYALRDSISKEIFYVGKGIENRVFYHEKEASKIEQAEKNKTKSNT